jgi:hypothetical protein
MAAIDTQLNPLEKEPIAPSPISMVPKQCNQNNDGDRNTDQPKQ